MQTDIISSYNTKREYIEKLNDKLVMVYPLEIIVEYSTIYDDFYIDMDISTMVFTSIKPTVQECIDEFIEDLIIQYNVLTKASDTTLTKGGLEAKKWLLNNIREV